MIFRYTEEEKAKIREFEVKARAQGITIDDFGMDIAEVEEVGTDEIVVKLVPKENKTLETLLIELEGLLREFEKQREQSLNTQDEIIESAKKKTKDALTYFYNSYSNIVNTESPSIVEQVFSIPKPADKDFFQSIIRFGTEKEFSLVDEIPDCKPVFLWDYKSCLELIKEKIIDFHYSKLKGSAGEEELNKEIEAILLSSKYISVTNNGFVNSIARYKDGSITINKNFIPLQKELRKAKRTESKAKEVGAITEGPKNLIIPTMSNYQNSLSLYQGGNAFLQPLSSMDNLKFDNGKLYFSDGRAREVSEAELRDLRTKEGIEELDLTNLRYYYSILFDQFQKSDYKVLQDIIKVSVPLLAGRKDPKESDINAVISKLQSYHNVMGVVKSPWNGKVGESYYQVLNFEYYDKTHNIVAFSSPYMNYVIQKMYNLSIRRENGKPKLTRNGKPVTLPTHSYLIDESIRKERNKVAVENVINIVALIEQAGNNEPHIKASTLIERNIQLVERLETTKNASLILNRTFKKTWELLREKTFLTEAYEGIELPDPEDPAFLPTMKTLDKVVFKFPHKGKKKVL